jgi:hypothetical protein
MGLFSSLGGMLNPFGGGGGGGGSSFSSGGIGSESGTTKDTGNTNTTSTSTSTVTTNTDKRLVINSGAVGVSTDTAPVTVNNSSVDPQNYQALLAVTDHLASGTLMLMAANMDAANQVNGITSADGSTSSTATSTTFKEFYTNNKAGVLVAVALVAYFALRK